MASEDPASMLRDLDLSSEEVKKLTHAFEDPEFRRLFGEYAAELSDPENRRRYEEEITALERERGVQVRFVHPEPGHVLRTSLNGAQPCFVNVCGNPLVGRPSSQPGTGGPQGTSRGQLWSLPYSLAPGREYLGRRGARYKVYDVIFHPDTLSWGERHARFRSMVDSTALEAVEKQFGVKLDRRNARTLKTKYKGTPEAAVLRTPLPGGRPPVPEGEEASGDGPLPAFPYPSPYPDPAAKKPPAPQPQGPTPPREEPAAPAPTVPRHRLVQRHHVDLQDYRRSRDSGPSTVPRELVLTVELPLLRSTARAALEVTGKRLSLDSRKPDYRLRLPLPYAVDESRGSARFNKAKRQLVVTLPVVPPKHGVAHPGGPPEQQDIEEEEGKEEEKAKEKEEKIREEKGKEEKEEEGKEKEEKAKEKEEKIREEEKGKEAGKEEKIEDKGKEEKAKKKEEKREEEKIEEEKEEKIKEEKVKDKEEKKEEKGKEEEKTKEKEEKIKEEKVKQKEEKTKEKEEKIEEEKEEKIKEEKVKQKEEKTKEKEKKIKEEEKEEEIRAGAGLLQPEQGEELEGPLASKDLPEADVSGPACAPEGLGSPSLEPLRDARTCKDWSRGVSSEAFAPLQPRPEHSWARAGEEIRAGPERALRGSAMSTASGRPRGPSAGGGGETPRSGNAGPAGVRTAGPRRGPGAEEPAGAGAGAGGRSEGPAPGNAGSPGEPKEKTSGNESLPESPNKAQTVSITETTRGEPLCPPLQCSQDEESLILLIQVPQVHPQSLQGDLRPHQYTLCFSTQNLLSYSFILQFVPENKLSTKEPKINISSFNTVIELAKSPESYGHWRKWYFGLSNNCMQEKSFVIEENVDEFLEGILNFKKSAPKTQPLIEVLEVSDKKTQIQLKSHDVDVHDQLNENEQRINIRNHLTEKENILQANTSNNNSTTDVEKKHTKGDVKLAVKALEKNSCGSVPCLQHDPPSASTEVTGKSQQPDSVSKSFFTEEKIAFNSNDEKQNLKQPALMEEKELNVDHRLQNIKETNMKDGSVQIIKEHATKCAFTFQNSLLYDLD